ncbi:Exosortase EpsH-related protein [Coraliomargarita akajimensis DSM 45221]|uniref:Exosortase EpsH-related protein n=2 Tax=Coraliomargarita TaxID=442430 RepID=D5EHV9_CORAD|nr:Exosortase EpsH-related protein [Coraliomargarita akajimensis DSM 45221]
MLLGLVVYMIWDQLHWWGEREDYSFGYLVPLFVGYVLFDRWPLIRSYLFVGAKPGEEMGDETLAPGVVRLFNGAAFAAFSASILLYAVGALLRAVTGPQNPASLAIAGGFAGIALSAIFILVKERADGTAMPLKKRLAVTALFLFPVLIWLISAPLVSVAEKQVRVFLLTQVTIIVFNVLDLLSYEIERQGNVLHLPKGQVGVEEACSGIRSLTACLFAGSFLAAVFLDRFWKKVLMVLAAMVLAVVTNLMRSFFLTLWAYHHGAEAIDEHWHLPLIGDIGSVHDVTGFAILGVTCVCLLCLLPVFNFKLLDMGDGWDEYVDDESAPEGEVLDTENQEETK